MDLIDRLYQKINEEPLRPKVLLANSHAQGHQLLEQICKRYGSVFNVEIQTLRAVVVAKTKLELFRRQIRLLEEGQTFWIVRFLMKQLAEADPRCYITESMLKPGIVDRVHRTITEMRLACIRSGEIKVEHFTNPLKGRYLQQLLTCYEAYLLENKLTDFAGLSEYLKKPEADETIYLSAVPTGWSRAERQMIEKMARDRLCLLSSDAPFYDNNFAANRLTMFRATGSVAEVREGLRRMLTEQLALDRTEIILSDYEQYAPVVHSLAETLGLACTLSSGLPLDFCAAGRAALGILEWIEDGYLVNKLAELLRHGIVNFSDDRWSTGDWVRLLERSGIGWGRERYLVMLRPERLNEEDQVQGAVLSTHIEQWFNQLPEGNDWNPIALLAWVAGFVKHYAPARTSDDVAIVATLQETAKHYSASPSETMPMVLAIRYVREMLSGIRIRVSATPKPGAVHVSSLQNGGLSGRDRTWILGMDERAWSVSVVQDPLLLDEERAVLSGDLESVGEQARRTRLERESRLSLIRGEVWFSYSSYDVGEQKGQSPAFEMLQVLRMQTGDSSKDFGALEHVLGEPYSAIDVMHPAEFRDSIDASDEWVRLLLNANGKRKDGWKAMHHAYPSLAQGYRAGLLRQDEKLSAYDGWLELKAEESSGERPHISASQLEKFAECGLKYYFGYVLKLRPKEIAEFDRTRWLQANERGSLLHEVFQRYLAEVTDRGSNPAKHSRSRLFEIVGDVLQKYALDVPAPSSHVLAKECDEIRRDAEIFYRNEVGRTEQPVFFELELTTHGGEPMEIALSDGIRVKLKGFIDRIDRIAPHEYRIIDYKTGSPNKYKPSEYFSGGTQLQHALYAIAAEQWLRETGADPLARVVEAEYYFPTERGRGEFVRRLQNRREELSSVVANMLESINQGMYVPTKDPGGCRYCEYKAVCGSHADWMKDKRESPVNQDILTKLLEVESVG